MAGKIQLMIINAVKKKGLTLGELEKYYSNKTQGRRMIDSMVVVGMLSLKNGKYRKYKEGKSNGDRKGKINDADAKSNENR